MNESFPRIARRTSTALVGAALAAIAFSPPAAFAAPEVINSIRAVVNGEPITQLEVNNAVSTQMQMFLMDRKGLVSRAQAEAELKRIEERALEELIDRKLILSEFKRMGGNIKDSYIDDAVNRFIQSRFDGDKRKFTEELKKSGMTIAQFREVQKEQIAVRALRDQNVGNDPIPNTPWEKKKAYKEIKDEFKTAGKPEVRILSIAKKKDGSDESQQKALAERLQSQIRSGSDFGALAKEHSDDTSASKGGYIGTIGKNGPLNPRLTQAAYQSPSGSVHLLDDGPFWRIMKVDRVGGSTPSYEELEEKVDQRLTAEKREEKMDEWLAKLRRDANVRIHD